VLLSVEVTRLTVASVIADDNPELATRLAPSAPPALVSMAMRHVGEAAARGGDPDDATFRRLRAVAVSDPLRPEPFLVEAAMAERVGAYDRAKQLLLQARSRDPRSAAARYLYADTAVRQGDVLEGLQEMAVLSRLVPAASVQIVPALAQFAQTPGSHEKLAAILAQNPQLKSPLLAALAGNPDNADLILVLAGPPTAKPNNDTLAWEARLLRGMVARGDYQNAYDVWRHFALLPNGARPLLFNGSFQVVAAPEPFNWGYSASPAGVAEPGAGVISVLYYGREDAVLADQLLILPPGSYRFTSPISGKVVAGALSWTIACVGAKDPLVDIRLDTTASPSGTFTVPAEACPAQRLQLNGHQEESPEDSNLRIGPASIERIEG
jgi:hypothetical protein